MHDIGRRFHFIINKIENNTLYISNIINQNSSEFNSNNFELTSSNVSNSNDTNNLVPYDSYGAARYIVVVVLVYGFGIIFFIGSQVRSTKKFSDEVDSVNAEKILRSMETEIFTKEVLEKLSDKDHREKAWKIYLEDKPAKPGETNEKIFPENDYTSSKSSKSGSDKNFNHIDREAVENIEKKIKFINKGQSGYKKDTITEAEVETVKEVFKPRHKFSNNRNNELDCVNFSKKNRKSPSTPILILQTDVEGLMKLKKSRSKQKLKHSSNHNLDQKNSNRSQISLSNYEEDENLKTSDSIDSDSNVSFDRCEISEQITSV